jgi:hypothetical protein
MEGLQTQSGPQHCVMVVKERQLLGFSGFYNTLRDFQSNTFE